MIRLAPIPLFLLLSGLASAQTTPEPPDAPVPTPIAAAGLARVDRLVAVVDDDPIFFSDLRRAIQLGLVDTGGSGDPWRFALDRLVDQRLRAHEVDRYGIPPAAASAIAEQVDSLETRLGGPEKLAIELASLGSDVAELEHLVGQQLRVFGYVDERLAPRVLIDDEAIEAYHRDELRAELERQGQPLPPLEQVREGIRNVLHQQAINREIGVWTEDLRSRARIRDVLGVELIQEALPAVVMTVRPRS